MNARVLKILRLVSVIAFSLLLVVIVGIAIYTFQDPIPDKLGREAENTNNNIVTDVTELYPVEVMDILVPHTVEEIAEAVKNHERISIGGGRFSMGGQTASEHTVHMDMREYNQVMSFSKEMKEVRVQSGIRWRDLQDYIDPRGLSVKIMQTYSNFTVGGSLSVNVHGRYVGLGPIISSVKQFSLVLADGSIVEASRYVNSDLFYSAIGGMGGIGVISEVTLSLAENTNVERQRELVSTDQYWDYFSDNVRNNPEVIFHNGDIYPPDFDAVSAVNWINTDKAPTTEDLAIPREKDYWLERIAWIIMSEWHSGRWIRRHIIDPILYSGDAPVHTRNYEASYDVAELEPPNRADSTYVLQEYFVPVENFDEWIPKMRQVFDEFDVNLINVSIRHALADNGAKLAWARRECFAFVVYYKQGTDEAARDDAAKWTREMIDQVISVDGTYYLPYQPHATDDQFHQAYPGAIDYFKIKNQYDPNNKFTNKLWDKYYSKEKLDYYESLNQAFKNVAPEGYFRPYDNAYLSIPEWYIVYSADEYATILDGNLPSHFDYLQAIRDFWDQHEQVISLTESSTNDNSDYETVLNVIGWSFTTENIMKWLYENIPGKVSEIVAGNSHVTEDKFAARVAKDYADFIYDYPWYDFPYSKYLKELWLLDGSSTTSFRQYFRRAERKYILTMELGIKAIYSSIIAYATREKFGVQDDIIYAVISEDNADSYKIISAPHYQPFTRLLLKELVMNNWNPEFTIFDISGNDKITFTYLDSPGAKVVTNAIELLRDSEVVAVTNGINEFSDRITVEANVNDLPEIYKSLQRNNVDIAHFYDY